MEKYFTPGWISKYFMLIMGAWMSWGFLIFIIGFFAAPDRNWHKEIYQLAVYYPSLWMLVLTMGRAFNEWRLLMPILVVAGLTLPGVWAPEHLDYGNTRLFKTFLQLSMFFLAIYWLVRESPVFLKNVFLIFLVASILIGIFILVEYVVTHPNWIHGVMRPSWRFYNQNTMAKTYGVVLLLSLWAMISIRNYAGKAIAAMGFLVSVVVILLSRSKGATYAVVLTLPFMLLLLPDVRIVLKRHLKIVVVSTLVLIAIIVEIGTVSDFVRDGWSIRDKIWPAAISEWKEKPWFGVGYLHDATIIATDNRSYGHEHNLMLAILREAGVYGMTIFTLGLGWLFIAAYKNQNSIMRLLWMWFLYGLLASMSGGKYLIQDLVEMWAWFWLPLALIFSGVLLPEKFKEVERQWINSFGEYQFVLNREKING